MNRSRRKAIAFVFLFRTVAAIASLTATFCVQAAAPRWELLGPTGGDVSTVARGAGNKVYALIVQEKVRTYTSDDANEWIEQAGPGRCGWPYSSKLQIRSDGDVFLHCNGPILRSRDGTRSWTPFTPDAIDGQLVFDPQFILTRAYVRWGSVGYTLDDGTNWLFAPLRSPGPPTYIAFDRFRSGRLIGVGTEQVSVASGTEYRMRFYESRDEGATWTALSSVLPPNSGDPVCFERGFAIDAVGRLFLNADCGLLRSADGGRTWQRIAGFPGDRLSPIVFDPSNSDRVVVNSRDTLYESRDAGLTWSALPATPAEYTQDFDIGTAGDLWAATSDGVYVYDPSIAQWLPRNAGLFARPAAVIEPAVGNGLVLSEIDGNYPYKRHVQSVDGGRSWSPYNLGGKAAGALARNISAPNSLMAVTQDPAELFSSGDGGLTWQLVNAHASPAPQQIVGTLVPVGPQPGVVYGTYQTCVGLFTGCFWTPQGVTKSVDGGVTWTNMNSGIAGRVLRIAVSPVGHDTIFAQATDGLYVSRDGAAHWQSTGYFFQGAHLIADLAEAPRWYAVDGIGRSISTTLDFGQNWSELLAPDLGTAGFDLVIDARDPRTLYAVGPRADVAISRDRGASWQSILAPSSTLVLASQSARLSPAPYTALYAASIQGVVRFDVANYQGLWWNASESGWGVNFAQQGDLIYLTWYTYDSAGKASWLAMLARRTGPSTFSGDIIEVHGSPYNVTPYNAAAKTVNTVGSGNLTFTNDGAATFNYVAKNVSRSIALARFSLGGPAPVCGYASAANIAASVNYQDLWWGGAAEDGWGINLAHEGDKIYATWYTYDTDGSPLWLAALMNQTTPGVFTGTLLRATGPAFGAMFDSSSVVLTAVGNAMLTIVNGNSATWSYQVGATVGVKPITRFMFSAPAGTACQ